MRSAIRKPLVEALPAKEALKVKLAETPDELRAAQRLRYEIFTNEFGANLQSLTPLLDSDCYDPFCHHLVVKNAMGMVIATTRLLDEKNAMLNGGFYSENEFDLTAVKILQGRKLEIGRTCVHADYRSGATLALLWSGIARFVLEHQYDFLLGCGSISIRNGFEDAWSITHQLMRRHGLDPELKVSPRRPLPSVDTPADPPAAIPALIKAYCRLGAGIGGPPCWDPDFQCADLFILLPVRALEARYVRHFLKPGDETR